MGSPGRAPKTESIVHGPPKVEKLNEIKQNETNRSKRSKTKRIKMNCIDLKPKDKMRQTKT